SSRNRSVLAGGAILPTATVSRCRGHRTDDRITALSWTGNDRQSPGFPHTDPSLLAALWGHYGVNREVTTLQLRAEREPQPRRPLRAGVNLLWSSLAITCTVRERPLKTPSFACSGTVGRWVMSKTACVLLVSGGPVRPADRGGGFGAVFGGRRVSPGLAWSR